ncbi:MAG TPA: WD40 repeat domain-containing protein [Chloroflexia bacterium]|nr:WD40 repeat domain-containing protein [Chloroflexia bacterium]
MQAYSKRFQQLLVVTVLILATILTACGDINPTPNQAAATPVPATGHATAPATLTASLPLGTPTPAPILTKGRLKEIFPVLQKLPEANNVVIHDDWSGIAYKDRIPLDNQKIHYTLDRQGNQFTGSVIYSNGQSYALSYSPFAGYQEVIEEITVPADVMSKFLQMLADTPVYEGRFTASPVATHTDDYPSLHLFVNTGNGTLIFSSYSQQDDFYPWSVSFAGRQYSAEDASPFGAFSLLKPYLKKDDFQKLVDKLTPQAVPTGYPTIRPPQNSAVLTAVYNIPVKLSDIYSFVIPLNLAFSADGKTLVGASDKGDIVTWNTVDGKLLNSTKGSNETHNTIAFSSNLNMMATSSTLYYYPNTSIKLQNKNGKELLSLAGHTDEVVSLVFSPDDKILASGSLDRTIKLWEMPGGRLITTLKRQSLQTYQVYTIAFSPDGKTLAAAGGGDTTTNQYPIILWDVASGKEIGSLPGHSAPVTSLTFSPDGKTLLSGGNDNQLHLWDVGAKKERLALTGPTSIHELHISPDGKLIATVYLNGQLNIWEAATGKLLFSGAANPAQPNKYPDNLARLAFSPDGKYLAILSGGEKEGTLRLWKLNL